MSPRLHSPCSLTHLDDESVAMWANKNALSLSVHFCPLASSLPVSTLHHEAYICNRAALGLKLSHGSRGSKCLASREVVQTRMWTGDIETISLKGERSAWSNMNPYTVFKIHRRYKYKYLAPYRAYQTPSICTSIMLWSCLSENLCFPWFNENKRLTVIIERLTRREQNRNQHQVENVFKAC